MMQFQGHIQVGIFSKNIFTTAKVVALWQGNSPIERENM